MESSIVVISLFAFYYYSHQLLCKYTSRGIDSLQSLQTKGQLKLHEMWVLHSPFPIIINVWCEKQSQPNITHNAQFLGLLPIISANSLVIPQN